MKRVVNKSTKAESGNILSKYNIFDKDVAEDQVYGISGFESIPLDNDEMLMAKLDSGDNAVYLTPLKTAIKKGERRIYSTDSSGNEKAEIFMDENGNVSTSNTSLTVTFYNDGKVEIKGNAGDLTAFIHELATSVKDLITGLSTATVPTAIGPQLLSIAPDLIAKIPAATLLVENINTFKK